MTSPIFPGRVGTGIAGLDAILNGGLPPHRLYLVEGDPGAGKTTLALQFLMEGIKRGETGLYVSLSETRQELIDVAASHGWTLDGLHVHEMAVGEESLAPEAQYTLFHPSEVELGETTRSVLDEVERIRPTRAVFDSLSEMRLLARDPLRYRRQVLALKQFFIGRGCTVLLLDDRTSGEGDLQLQSLAHGVIAMERVERDYGSERRRLRVVKLRGVRYQGGYHDFNIATGGVVAFPRLVASDHRPGFAPERVASGVPALDVLLGGGLDRGTSTLLMGPAGSGKSALASQYAVAAASRGDRAAIYAFDEGLQTLFARASGLGLDLRGLVESGSIVAQQVDPAELSPGEFAARLCRAVEADGVRVVVIDSLNGYLNAMPEERLLTAQMHELLTYLNQQGVVTLLIMAQHGMLGSGMISPVDVSYLADTVLLLRYFEAAGAVHKAISVVKKRTGSHESTIRELRLGPGGLRVGEPLSAFHGILSGTPSFHGTGLTLLEGEHERRGT